jgi:dihydroxyacetone kinase-like protein
MVTTEQPPPGSEVSAMNMTLDEAMAWVTRFIAHVKASKSDFAELDRRAGDGDFGTNVESAVIKAEHYLRESPPTTTAQVLQRLAKGFLATGGTSGPLLGTWLREIAKGLDPIPNASGFAAGVSAGTNAVQRLGRASVGDRTMVDAMVPATEALNEAATTERTLGVALGCAARAAARGAESTSGMVGRKGRASYVGDVVKGTPDPGAVLIASLFATAAIVLEARPH